MRLNLTTKTAALMCAAIFSTAAQAQTVGRDVPIGTVLDNGNVVVQTVSGKHVGIPQVAQNCGGTACPSTSSGSGGGVSIGTTSGTARDAALAIAAENAALTAATNAATAVTYKTTFRGAWTANTAYALNDEVTQGGNFYIAPAAFTSTSTFNAGNWTLILAASGGGPTYTAGTGISINGSNVIANTGVLTFNTRAGAITLTSSDVIAALAYTPISPSGTPTTGHCAQFASATTISDAGAACGSGGGTTYTGTAPIVVTSGVISAPTVVTSVAGLGGPTISASALNSALAATSGISFTSPAPFGTTYTLPSVADTLIGQIGLASSLATSLPATPQLYGGTNSAGVAQAVTPSHDFSLQSNTLSTSGYYNVQSPLYATSYPSGCGVRLTDLTWAVNTSVITSASYTFPTTICGQSVVGMTIGIRSALSPPVRSANTTILSISGNTATVAATLTQPSSTSTGIATFGPNDQPAIQNAVNAANAAGGGTVYFPPGYYNIASTISIYGNTIFHGAGQNVSHVVYETGAATTSTPMFYNSSGLPKYNMGWDNLDLDAEDTYNTGSYNANSTIIRIQFVYNLNVHDNYMHGSLATALGVDYLSGAFVSRNTFQNCGRGAVYGGTTPGGACIGTSENAGVSYVSSLFDNNVIIMPTTNNGTYGIFHEGPSTTLVNATGYSSVTNNKIFLNGTNQKAIGCEGVGPCMISGNTVVGTGVAGQVCVAYTNASYNNFPTGAYGNNNVNTCKNVDYGVEYLPNANTPAAAFLNFSNFLIYGCLHNGFHIGTGSVQVDTVEIRSSLVQGCQQAGMDVTGAGGVKNLHLISDTWTGNALGATAANEKAAVSLQAPVNGLVMTNNITNDDGAGTQLYGLIADGASTAITNGHIVGNDFSGAVTGAVSVTTSASITSYWNSNKGLTSTVSGLSSFPCSSYGVGSVIPVTDALTPTYNGTLTGGSTTYALASCTGTAWTSH